MAEVLKLKYLLPLALLLLTVSVAGVVKFGLIPGLATTGAAAGSVFLVLVLRSRNFAMGALLIILFFIFYITRIVGGLPIGATIDFMTLMVFASLLIQEKSNTYRLNSIYKYPITLALTFWAFYAIIQAFNPNSVSIIPWLYVTKEAFGGMLIPFLIFWMYFQEKKDVKFFFKAFLGLSLLTALYSFYQEYIGLTDFEKDWVFRKPGRFDLIFIWGHFRKWSFLSDVVAFAVLMAYSAIVTLCMALGPFERRRRILLLVSSVIMLWAMSFSGTRTAFAMIPAGLSLYFILTLNHKSTRIFIGVSAFIFIFLLFAPIYNPTLKRLRSTFEGEEDASMSVRERNRSVIQPYIWENPMGGGVGTTGNAGIELAPNHPLAGFPPDNGFLKVALEKGWIGLLLTLGFLGTTLFQGVYSYFKVKDPKIRNIIAALTSGFFALVVANFAQEATTPKPVYLAVIATFVLTRRLYDIDKNENTKGDEKL